MTKNDKIALFDFIMGIALHVILLAWFVAYLLWFSLGTELVIPNEIAIATLIVLFWRQYD